MNPILTAKDLCKTYIVKEYSNNVLCNVNFTLEQGEFVSVMGPSGSGKSTLLYTVSGMDEMTSGEVLFDGRNLAGMSAKELSKLRLLEMGFIFQQMYMLKKLCIMDNIVLPGYQAGKNRTEVNQRAEELMRRLGIIEIAEHEIHEVSGGQLQRACICRALINQPKVIFADEPTGSLNSKAAGEVIQELLRVNQEGTSILMVTHSAKVAAQSDRVIYLIDGNIQGELKLSDSRLSVSDSNKQENGEKKLTSGRSEEEIAKRERTLNEWLIEQGW